MHTFNTNQIDVLRAALTMAFDHYLNTESEEEYLAFVQTAVALGADKDALLDQQELVFA